MRENFQNPNKLKSIFGMLPEIKKEDLDKYNDDEIIHILMEGAKNTYKKYYQVIKAIGEGKVYKYIQSYLNVPFVLKLLHDYKKDYYELILTDCRVFHIYIEFLRELRKWLIGDDKV